MTRRERQGTIVVLAVIAVLCVATLVVRSCGDHEPTAVQQAEVLKLQAEADSAAVRAEQRSGNQGKHAIKRSRKRRKTTPRPSKKSAPPRRLDPVPQFSGGERWNFEFWMPFF